MFNQGKQNIKTYKNSDNKFFKLKENKNKKVNCPNLLA